jgi:hypothetical protein
MTTGNIISTSTLLDRVGTEAERPEDRRLAFGMLCWGFRQEHRRAIAAQDYAALDELDRRYERMHSL